MGALREYSPFLAVTLNAVAWGWLGLSCFLYRFKASCSELFVCYDDSCLFKRSEHAVLSCGDLCFSFDGAEAATSDPTDPSHPALH